MSYIYFTNSEGKQVAVSADNPLPTSGSGGGGGMTPEDITATAPLAWDAETSTMSADLSGYATDAELTSGLAGKANTTHTHAGEDITSGTVAAARIATLSIGKTSGLQAALDSKLQATPAAAQADSTATDATGLVADFNALLAKLRTAGLLAE